MSLLNSQAQVQAIVRPNAISQDAIAATPADFNVNDNKNLDI